MSTKGGTSPGQVVSSPSVRDSPLVGQGGAGILDDEEDFFKFSVSEPESDSLSGEETEDASENESYQHAELSQYTELKEQMYQDKLNQLKKQLQQLAELTHPEWLRRNKRLEQQHRERLRINLVVKELELEMVEQDYLSEKKAAAREFEEKKVYLREQLISQLEEKQKMIEQERTSMELTGDSMELKPISTRKLRRRANEPSDRNGFRYGPGEKRRKQVQATMSYLLDDKDVEEDLKIINKTLNSCGAGKGSQSGVKNESGGLSSPVGQGQPGQSQGQTVAGAGGVVPAPSVHQSFPKDARIEDGKLFYQKRWFRRGQTIMVEDRRGNSLPDRNNSNTESTTTFGATISAIGADTIWVRKAEDSSKVSILLSQLNKGKFCLKRRAQ